MDALVFMRLGWVGGNESGMSAAGELASSEGRVHDQWRKTGETGRRITMAGTKGSP